MSHIQTYLAGLTNTLHQLPQEQIAHVIQILRHAREQRKQIFLIGNGGSAGTASHFMNDLLKGTAAPGKPRIKAIALSDNVPTMLAYANDRDYDCIFAEQLEALAEPGDVLIAFSGSGRSANILNALGLARARGLTTIGFTGRDGGEMKARCEVCLIVPCEAMEQIEDVHMILTHLIYTSLRDEATL